MRASFGRSIVKETVAPGWSTEACSVRPVQQEDDSGVSWGKGELSYTRLASAR